MSEYIVRMQSDMPYEIKAELNAWYVNSEPIVRCRDCKHYEDYTGCCTRRDYVAPMAVTAGGFCAWGERREP